MEIIDGTKLREVPLFYKGYSSLKQGVKFESVNYMLRIPTEKELDGVAITHGVANYLYSKFAKLFGLECENVKLVNYDNIITSMCRDFEIDKNAKFYSMEDINGRFDLSTSMDVYNMMDVCTELDNLYLGGSFTILKRFMETIVLDFITGNYNRRLCGSGILVRSKVFVELAPIFGGAMAFDSCLKLATMKEIVASGRFERRCTWQEFNYLKCNEERIVPYTFIIKDKSIADVVIEQFVNVSENDIYNIVNRMNMIDEFTKSYIINMVLLHIDMLKSI